MSLLAMQVKGEDRTAGWRWEQGQDRLSVRVLPVTPLSHRLCFSTFVIGDLFSFLIGVFQNQSKALYACSVIRCTEWYLICSSDPTRRIV